MTQPFEPDGVPADLAALYPDVGAPSPTEASAAGLKGLHAMLDAERPLDRVSGLSTPVRWGLALALVAALSGLVIVATARPDLGVYPHGRMALDLSLLLGPLALALLATLRPLSRPALSIGRRLQTVVLGVVGVLSLLVLPVAHVLHPASSAASGALFWKQAAACFGFGSVFAMFATVGLGVLSRNGVRRWLPGPLGVWAAGLTGLTALYLHCPITGHDHLWAGHATIIVPLLAVAWWLRGRLDG